MTRLSFAPAVAAACDSDLVILCVGEAADMSGENASRSPLRIDRPAVKGDGRPAAEITVTNTGAGAGVETVFWFIRDPVAAITRPLKELKHFEQATLAPDESRAIRFEIEPLRDLAYPDADGHPRLEPGEIILLAGHQHASFQVLP